MVVDMSIDSFHINNDRLVPLLSTKRQTVFLTLLPHFLIMTWIDFKVSRFLLAKYYLHDWIHALTYSKLVIQSDKIRVIISLNFDFLRHNCLVQRSGH